MGWNYLPNKLRRWFRSSGYFIVEDHTNIISPKNLTNLLQAQTAYLAGYSVCLFVDGDIFRPISKKRGSSIIPNHWVMMNAPVQIRSHNRADQSTTATPRTINTNMVKALLNEVEDQNDEAEMNVYNKLHEFKDKILLNAFSWGKQNMPASDRIRINQVADLGYFLRGYYGYIKAKR